MAADNPSLPLDISEKCAESPPPDAEGQKPERPKVPEKKEDWECKHIKAIIDFMMREIERRIHEQLMGRPPGALYPDGTLHKQEDVSGRDVWAGHDKQITESKNALNTLINMYQNKNKFINKKCPDPPDDPGLKNVRRAIDSPNPTLEDWEKTHETTVDKWLKDHPNSVRATAAVGAVYIVYRVIRFIPSLLPPLWPTIPENLAIP